MVKDKKKLVLLDAHAIIHRAYHALPDFESKTGEPTGALYGLVSMLLRIINNLKPDYIIACYDLPEKTFRHEAYDHYKAGRKKTEPALVGQLEKSRDVFKSFNVPIYDSPGFEADDILGTIVEKLKKQQNLDIVIASGDLDTLQLVEGDRVQIFTLKKGITDTIFYNETAVMERFNFLPKLMVDYKGLRGDPSDNIIGVAGIGEKTATTLIKEIGSLEEIYKKLKHDEVFFKKIGISDRIVKLLKENKEEAFFSKTLAQIRRDAPINFSLPKKEWRNTVDTQEIETLFKTLGFKSLFDRFYKSFPKAGDIKLETVFVSGDDAEESQIGLWLLNSEKTNPSNNDVLEYTGSDNFKDAREKILKELKNRGLEYVFQEIELPIVLIIKKMEEQGVLIDKNYLKKLSLEYHKKLAILEKKIWEKAGQEFNINSPNQLAEILFNKLQLIPTDGRRISKTKGGVRSTKISELEKLQGSSPIIDYIIDYRELQKLLSTYIDSIPKILGKDNRLHANFIQTGTSTGRFSSSNPNLQNIPIRSNLGKRIRNAFIAPKGFKLVAFDYSQIELRAVAFLAQDEQLLKILEAGKDVHTAVSSKVFEVPENKVTEDMRRRAKVINFGIIYGMGISALQKNLKSTREEAKQFYDNYFKQFPQVETYLEEVKKFAKDMNYTETLFGRKRYFQGLKSRIPFIRAMAERMAQNAPIQGTVADIIKLAIKDAERLLIDAGLNKKVHLILQIHDELIYEVPEDEVEKVSQIIQSAMEKAIPSDYFKNKKKISLVVKVSSGYNWGEM